MFIKELIFTKITRKTFVWNFVFIVIGNLIRHFYQDNVLRFLLKLLKFCFTLDKIYLNHKILLIGGCDKIYMLKSRIMYLSSKIA